MEVKTRFTFDKVVFNKDNDLHLVISLKTPTVEVAEVRRPLLIMPVLDISGSMDNSSKLEFAKQSILKLIDHLQENDFCGLVTFESEVKLVSEILPMTSLNKELLKSQVKALIPLGGTAFGEGMLLGLKQVNNFKVPDNTLVRVIMFTDGQANIGPKGKELLGLLETNLKNVTLSAFGYGKDADQELLADLSSMANGNYAFIKNVEDAPLAFARELGGLLSVYAQNIKIAVQTKGNNKLTEVLNDLNHVTDNNVTVFSIPDLLSEDNYNLILAIKSTKLCQAEALLQPVKDEVVSIKVTYDTVLHGVKKSHELSIGANLEFVNAGEEDIKQNPEVDAVVAVIQMAQAQKKANDLAKAGNYNSASQIMTLMSEDFSSRGLVGASNVASKLSCKMKSQLDYATSSGYRSSTYTKSKGSRIVLADREADQDLEQLGVSSYNSTQANIVESFNSSTACSIKNK